MPKLSLVHCVSTCVFLSVCLSSSIALRLPQLSLSPYPARSIVLTESIKPPSPPAAILDDQSSCGRGERLALALARENINSLMEAPSRARVEVDIYELQKDSQYDTTDTSKYTPLPLWFTLVLNGSSVK